MNNKSAIGLLGGTFDPIHWGHIKIAEFCLKKLSLEKVLFLPNKIPPHRGQPSASISDRLHMIELAIAENPQFELDKTETSREGPSYMIDTLKLLREKYPQTPLALIIGADAFEKFNTWQNWQDIPNYAHLIIVNRPNLPEAKEAWMADLLAKCLTSEPAQISQKISGCIYELQVEPINISASSIRKKLIAKQSIANDVPKCVFDTIIKNKLYREINE